MSKTSNSNWETTVKPIVVLSVISLVVRRRPARRRRSKPPLPA